MISAQEIAELNLISHEGVQSSARCPECGHYNFSVTKKNGKLLWNCFRVGCGISGAVVASYTRAVQEVPEPIARPFTGFLTPLTEAMATAIACKFNLPFETVMREISYTDTRYAVKLRGPKGEVRGVVLRRPWAGTEIIDKPVGGPKSITFKDDPLSPNLSWYYPENQVLSTCVLVEDQISAMRIANETPYTGVALLGTSLNEEKVMEIQRKVNNVIIALDSDATGHSFDLARKWGKAFWSCKVAILNKDIKNMTKEEVHALNL